MNSLFIIYEIFQLNQDILKSSVHTRLRSVLTEQLLLRINDEDIKLRNEAMLLFCYLDQNEIIPKLAIKLIDSNEKVRAASEAALLNTLLKHKSSVDVIFTYIEYIRSLNQENREKNIPMTPGQINSTYIKDNGPEYTKEQKEKLLERQFRVVRKWAKELATNSWLYIIDPLLKKVYASPEDQILVKFMSTISEFLIETPVVLTIFKQITKLMIEQPKLTEDLLNRNDEESSIIVKDILFLRISPLLVLRVLPNKAFDKLDISKTYNSEVLNKAITKKSDKDENEDEDENEEFNLDDMKNDEIIYLLFKELIQRIEQIYEFDQVRKLSVEILASLPIQYIFPYLKYVFEDGNKTKDLMQLKSYLYCLCNVVIKHSVEELEFTKFIDFSFHIPLEILITYSKDLNTKNKAIQNIQMGCIECLSLMICSFIKTLPGEEEEQKVLIKEIEEIEKDSNSLNKDSKEKISSFEQVVYALLQLLSPQRLQKMVISSDKFGKTLPKSFQPIVESLYIIQKQTQPLIFEILSISIANIFTTTIRHYSKEIENVSTTVNPTQSSPSNQTNPTSSPPPANSTPLSDEDCRKNIHSLYKFATQYLYYPLLDIVQEGILYHSSKEIQGNNLGILQEQLHDTLTCACLQVLYHLVYYLRDGKFKERELEDVLNVCLNGLGCDKSMIRESSLKLFSGLLSCNYNEPNASQNTTNKLNLNIVNHDTPIIASPLAALNYISSNNQEQASDINYVTHGLFSQGKHSLELIKAKHAIQQIAEMEEVSTSTPTLSLARKLIVLMNTY